MDPAGRIGELLDVDEPLGLVPDVDDDLIGQDPEHPPFHHLAFRQILEADVVKCEELLVLVLSHLGACRLGPFNLGSLDMPGSLGAIAFPSRAGNGVVSIEFVVQVHAVPNLLYLWGAGISLIPPPLLLPGTSLRRPKSRVGAERQRQDRLRLWRGIGTPLRQNRMRAK